MTNPIEEVRLLAIRASAQAAIAANAALVASIDAMLAEMQRQSVEAQMNQAKRVEECPKCGALPEYWANVDGQPDTVLCKICNTMFSVKEC